MARHAVRTDGAPGAIGPYSQGIRAGDTLFISGQIPVTPAGELVDGDSTAATRQALDNVRAILEAGG